MCIHEHKEWPSFSWDKELVGERLDKVHKAVGVARKLGVQLQNPTESSRYKRPDRERYSDTPAGAGP